MMTYLKLLPIFCLLTTVSLSGYGQVGSPKSQVDTTYTLNGDTLLTNKDFRIFVGQKLLSGNSSGENGWYRTITFKSGASWPVVMWQGVETKNNINYQLDPQMRVNDKVKEYLPSGTTLIVKKIKRNGNKRYGYWYTAILQTTDFPTIKFRANVGDALAVKELIIPDVEKTQ